MNETITDPNTSSASDDFEKIIQSAHEAHSSDMYPSGYATLTEEEKAALDAWISSPEAQSLIEDAFKGERRRFGIVLDIVNETNGYQRISYLNEFGTRPVFVYHPNSYPEAPQGFKVGDIIMMTYTKNPTTPDSTKPIQLAEEDRKEILSKIKSKYQK
jgi:hypothetical protein